MPSCLAVALLCHILPVLASLNKPHGQGESFKALRAHRSAQKDNLHDSDVVPASKELVARFAPARAVSKAIDAIQHALTAEDAVVEEEAADILVDYVPWRELDVPHSSCPSMYVVVMSRRDNVARRATIREMWKSAGDGWGSLLAQFGICKKAPDDGEAVSVEAQLQQEVETFGDVILLDCKEGYLHGQLTRKLVASMRVYLLNFAKAYELYMKTDDDAFVSTRRLCDFAITQPQSAVGFRNTYMGVFAEFGEHLQLGKEPCRDPSSDWYEPYSKFNESSYPVSAKGGPGYILAREMVHDIIQEGIADNYILNNEDKAVGVWVNALERRGQQIEILNLPGTDGYDQFHPLMRKSGPWNYYPYAVHHHLEASEISCLYEIDKARDPTRVVDDCFLQKKVAMLRTKPIKPHAPHGQELLGAESELSSELMTCLGY